MSASDGKLSDWPGESRLGVGRFGLIVKFDSGKGVSE